MGANKQILTKKMSTLYLQLKYDNDVHQTSVYKIKENVQLFTQKI